MSHDSEGPTLATRANMRKWEQAHPTRQIDTPDGKITIEGRKCFAYSPETDERYSASSGDYFTMRDDEPLKDEQGEPMILCIEETRILGIESL